VKYAQVVGRPDPEEAPEFFGILACSSAVNEARLHDSNVSKIDSPTALYEVDGDVTRTRKLLRGSPDVREVTATRITEGRFNLLVVFDTTEATVFGDALRTVSQKGLTVAKPVVYRDAEVHLRVVGESETLRNAVGNLPEEMAAEVVSVGEFDRGRGEPASGLSDRQREAIVAALDLGYYDCPRGATHADVAERLGCEPNTATEHLQKAESKILNEVM